MMIPRYAVGFGVVCTIAALRSTCGLDNGLAKTPPMGWMSWERFRCNVDCTADPDNCFSDRLVRQHVDILGSDEWHSLGYEYVNLDDCWLNWNRTADGRLKGNDTRFPSIKSLADYAHNAGLRLGIYQDMGTETCDNYPGVCKDENCTLPGYMTTDADTFAEWGIDSLKMDGCHSLWTSAVLDPGYEFMTSALNKTGRPILYSCSWPDYIRLGPTSRGIDDVNFTQTAEHCNIWRMYNDIQDSWASVTNIADWVGEHQEDLIPAAGPGHFNDPDMLIIGNFGLSYTQARAQMALWSIMAAPLLMGNDLRNLDPAMKAILQAKEVIAIDQDPLGIQGRRVEHNTTGSGYFFGDVWTKLLANDDLAVLLWNRCDYGTPRVMAANWTLLGLDAGKRMKVRDLYAEKDLGVFQDKVSLGVDIWDVAMLRMSPA